MLVDPRKRALLSKFEDLWDDANSAYVKLPAIPDKHGRLPGQRRPKQLVVHLPPLDPVRFPWLYNPEANGLANDPFAKQKRRPVAEDIATNDDDTAEKSVSEKLAAALRANAARVLDLFRQMDENGDGEISRDEFVAAFQEEKLLLDGLNVPIGACGALFNEWDADGSGSISFSELKRILSKRRAQPHPAVRRGKGQQEPRLCYATPRAGDDPLPRRDDRRGGRAMTTLH